MPKTATRNNLILLVSRNISQTVSEKAPDVINKTYPSGKQYLACPGAKEVRDDLDTFDRRRGGVDSWQMAKWCVLLLIKTCIMDGQKRKIKGIREFR